MTLSPSDFRNILYDKHDDGIVVLTFNKPKQKNALTALAFLEIYHAIDTFEKDQSAYVMIVTGADNPDNTDPSKQAYSSGANFNPNAMADVPEEVIAQIDFSDIAQKKTSLKMFDCPKPIIAAVNGLMIGGAFTLTYAGADLIYLSEHAWAQLPFAKLGISAELASSFLMPRLMGLQHAKQLMYFSERLDAQQMLDLKLANQVIKHDDLFDFAVAQAKKLMPPAGAPMSIQGIKQLLHEPLRQEIVQALDRENETLAKLVNSEDFVEAQFARAERRESHFKGC